MIFESRAAPLIPPPDNLSIPQFILDREFDHPNGPKRDASLPCLIQEDTGRIITLDELRTRTSALAKSISQKWRDAVADKTVALICPNHVDYPVCVWAILRLGGTVALIGPNLTSDELAAQLSLANPSMIIVHGDSLMRTLEALSTLKLTSVHFAIMNPEPDCAYPGIEDLIQRGLSLPDLVEARLGPGEAKTKIAFLCFSSGTTGAPKAILVSHYNVTCNVLQTATFNRVNEEYTALEERRFRPGDVCTGILPFFHIYGLVTNLHFLLYSSMIIVITRQFKFEQFLANIERYKITHLQIVPPIAVLLSKHPATRNHSLSSVRYCMVAAAPVSAELSGQLLQLLPGIHFGQGYGMTETCAAVSMFPLSQKVGTGGSAGQLISGTYAKVLKADGTEAGFNEPGELWVKGGQVVPGYLNNEEQASQSFVDGWYGTGDQVLFHENGDMFVTDRIKEIMKIKGFQVAPAELEGHLLKHPDVADAGVVGVPDDYAGELPFAFVVLHQGLSAVLKGDAALEVANRDKIFKHISDAKSNHKWLTGGIVFVDSIPKNGSGKILRRILRDQARTLRN